MTNPMTDAATRRLRFRAVYAAHAVTTCDYATLLVGEPQAGDRIMRRAILALCREKHLPESPVVVAGLKPVMA